MTNSEWKLSDEHYMEYDALFLKGSSDTGFYIKIADGVLSGGVYTCRINVIYTWDEQFKKEFESCDEVWDHIIDNVKDGTILMKLLFERFM